MRYFAVFSIPVLLALLIAACGGGDDNSSSATPNVPDELKAVCTQSATAATDKIRIGVPKAGDKFTSPLHIVGAVNSPNQQFFYTIVDSSGNHIADYPGHTLQAGTMTNLMDQVPFGVEKSTPACLWVYLDATNQTDAIRIPITVEPNPTATPSG